MQEFLNGLTDCGEKLEGEIKAPVPSSNGTGAGPLGYRSPADATDLQVHSGIGFVRNFWANLGADDAISSPRR
jgi:hypothetical protein